MILFLPSKSMHQVNDKKFFKILKKILAFHKKLCYYIGAEKNSDIKIRVWRSLVSRLNGVQEALSSNLSTRTISQVFRFLKTWFLLFLNGRYAYSANIKAPQTSSEVWGASIYLLVATVTRDIPD